jgi:hypothetical protein
MKKFGSGTRDKHPGSATLRLTKVNIQLYCLAGTVVDEAVIEHVAANHLLLRLPATPAAEGETSEAAGSRSLYGFVPGRQTREGGEMKDLRNGVATKIQDNKKYGALHQTERETLRVVLVTKTFYHNSSKYLLHLYLYIYYSALGPRFRIDLEQHPCNFYWRL